MGTWRTNSVRDLLVALNCEAEFCREPYFLALFHLCQTGRLVLFFRKNSPCMCSGI